MLVAVTGASGHIGANLCRLLLAEGHRVRALYRRDRAAIEGLPLEFVQGDVLNPDDVRRLVEGVEVVFHLAAIIELAGDPKGIMFRTNAEGPRIVAEACLQAGVRRMVYVSSIHAHDPRPLDQPQTEENPYAGPESYAYDRSKAAGERAVLAVAEKGLDVIILNPTGVIGPYDFKHSYKIRLLKDLYEGRMPALTTGGFDWVDVRDVAQAALSAATRPGKGGKYLIGGAFHTLAELAQFGAAATGLRPPRFSAPIWMGRLAVPFARLFARLSGKAPLFTHAALDAVEFANRQVSWAKAARELHYRPRPIAESVRDTYAWMFEAGIIQPRKS